MKKFYSVPQMNSSSGNEQISFSFPSLENVLPSKEEPLTSSFLSPISLFPIRSNDGSVFFLPLLSEKEADEIASPEANSHIFPSNKEFQEIIREKKLVYISSLSGRIVDSSLPFIRYQKDEEGRGFLSFTSNEK